jgi:signal transduction histidine kinase
VSLRRRITLAFIALVAAGSVVFAAISIAVITRTMGTEIDARLFTLARGIGQVVDYKHRVLSVDAADVKQMNTLHGPEEHLAVIDRHGRVVYGEQLPPPSQRAAYRFARTTKVKHNGDGTIVAWQSATPIAAVQRASLIAFFVVTLALILAAALLSHVFGGAFDRLEARLAAERRFVADASHELRTPLAVVRAETDLALRRTRSEHEYVEALRSIDGEVTRLEAIVDDLLDTLRDRDATTFAQVDLTEVVTRAANRMRPTVRELRVDFSGDPPSVSGHAEALERAMTTVLHNAATHGGGSIDVRVVTEPARVRIDVADDGPGFPPEALKHATERFWRSDSARSRGGTGLGLSIARTLVEAHGGKIVLANDGRRGAVVSLLLPTCAY